MAALISRKQSGLDDQTSRKPSGLNSQNSQKLYETYYMRVFSYAMTLAGDRNLAEEITQETFFRAFSRKNEFRVCRSPAEASRKRRSTGILHSGSM